MNSKFLAKGTKKKVQTEQFNKAVAAKFKEERDRLAREAAEER